MCYNRLLPVAHTTRSLTKPHIALGYSMEITYGVRNFLDSHMVYLKLLVSCLLLIYIVIKSYSHFIE